MDILMEPLVFNDASIVQIASYPSEKGPKCVMTMQMSCMPHHAESLGCAYIYKDGIPVADLAKLSIDGEYHDVDLYMPNAAKDDVEHYTPDLIYKMSLSRVADAKYTLTFRVHESTRRADLDMLLTAFNKDEFQIKIVSKQQSLFDGGTRVDMSAEPEPQDPPADLVDRSHENKPRRGRPRKHAPLSEEVVVTPAQPPVDIDEFYEAKYAAEHPEAAEENDGVLTL